MQIPESHNSIATLSIKTKSEMEDEAMTLRVWEGETCEPGIVGVRALPKFNWSLELDV